MPFLRTSFAKLALFVFPVLISISAMAAELPKVGDQAPDFTLNSQEGSPVSLSQFHGKYVVLYFYPKDMTQGCTIEAHNFQRDLSKYDQDNAVIVGVSVDSTDSHKEFCAKESLTFKLLADTEKKVADQYGTLSSKGFASRNTFLVDPNGKIVEVWTGVNPSKHSEEVLAELNKLK